MEQQQGYKAVILGGSGAVGREVISQLCTSNKWSKVVVVARRSLDQWKDLQESGKLEVIQHENLDVLKDTKQFNQFQNYNTLFCLLGTQVKVGEELFKKVDFQYPVFGAQIAKQNQIPHYSLLTSQGANKNSWFLYLKTKGQVEEAIKDQQLPYLSIFRPGAFLNRDNDERFAEKVLKYVPFINKITTKDLAHSIILEAEQAQSKKWTGVNVYEHKDLENKTYLNKE